MMTKTIRLHCWHHPLTNKWKKKKKTHSEHLYGPYQIPSISKTAFSQYLSESCQWSYKWLQSHSQVVFWKQIGHLQLQNNKLFSFSRGQNLQKRQYTLKGKPQDFCAYSLELKWYIILPTLQNILMMSKWSKSYQKKMCIPWFGL